MRTLVVVTLIFALCYLFSRPVFSSRWSFVGFRYFFLSGAEFLLVGYLVGPRGLNLVPPEILDSLDPVIHLALGWAGLIFGLQFHRKMIKLYAPMRYALSFWQALVAGAVSAGGGWLAFRLVFPDADPASALRAAVVIGVCAAPTTPSSVYYFSRVFRIRGRVNRLLKFISAVDGIPPVIALGAFAGLYHVSTSLFEASLPGWKWLVIGTGLGVVLGLMLAALVEIEFNRDELLLFVIGMVILTAGLARYLHLPAIFLSFVMGATATNAAWNREEVHKVAARIEKPIYLTFLVLAGTLLVFDDLRVFALAAGLVLLRLAGKAAGNLPWRSARFEPAVRTPWLGLALLSQGALAIVLAFDFEFIYRADPARAHLTQLAVSAVVLAILLNEILSPLFLRALFPAGGSEGKAAP